MYEKSKYNNRLSGKLDIYKSIFAVNNKILKRLTKIDNKLHVLVKYSALSTSQLAGLSYPEKPTPISEQ